MVLPPVLVFVLLVILATAIIIISSCNYRRPVATELRQPCIVVKSFTIPEDIHLQLHIALPLLTNNTAASFVATIEGSCFNTTSTVTNTHSDCKRRLKNKFSPVHSFIRFYCLLGKTQFTLTRTVHYMHKCWGFGSEEFGNFVDFAIVHCLMAQSNFSSIPPFDYCLLVNLHVS